MYISSSLVDVTTVKPSFLKMEKENTKLFYGVELEVNTRSYKDFAELNKRELEIISDIGEYAIFKPDGDFEIVTVPATLEFHRNVLWKKFFANSSKYVCAGQRNGIHIHFSKDAVTDLQLAKMIVFMNELSNEKFISGIADRSVLTTSWCKRVTIPKEARVNLAEVHKIDGIRANSKGRIIGLACHNNRGIFTTVEVRIFKSNPTEHGVFQALEFVDAIIKYCHNHGSLETEIGYQSFLDWFIGENKDDEYPYFAANLEKLGYIEKIGKGSINVTV